MRFEINIYILTKYIIIVKFIYTYFNQCAKEMEHHLLQRGYTKGCIRDAINKASSISREDALVDKTNDNQLTRVPFLVTYNPKLPSLPKILKESQTILHSSERCATVFPEVTFQLQKVKEP